jgi:magnesium-transporting ATPase (P-type)
VFAVVGLIWRSNVGIHHWYFIYTKSSSSFNLETLAFFLRFLTLISYFIPISLKVTLDFFKLFASLLITFDRDMWIWDNDDNSKNAGLENEKKKPKDTGGENKEEKKTKDNGAVARSTALLEELGQVTHVLSDKTGFLFFFNFIFNKEH